MANPDSTFHILVEKEIIAFQRGKKKEMVFFPVQQFSSDHEKTEGRRLCLLLAQCEYDSAP